MMKKMMSVLLALAMLITPMLAMAQDATAIDQAIAAGKTLKTSFSVVLDEGIVDAQTAEMLAAASLNMTFATEPAAQVGFSLTSGDETLGDLMIEVGEDDELYIRSMLLGDEIIRIDMADAELLLDRTLAFLVSLGMMTQEDADAARKAITVGEVQMTETAEAPVKISMFELMTMDYGPLMDAVVALADKVVYSDGANAPEDAAESYYGIELTGEDLAALADGVMTMIRSSKTLTVMMNGTEISSEEIAQMFSAVKSLSVGLYLDQQGAPVHLTLLPVITTQDGDYIGSISYSRRTEADKVTYLLDMGAALDPVEGEYTVLFNIPAALVIREDGLLMTADVLGYKVEAAMNVIATEAENGIFNEVNMSLTLTDPAGESLKGNVQMTWNECLATEEYPIQAYVMMFSVNDEEPLGGVMAMVSAIDPAGEALASQPYAQPAQMTQEEFNAFAENLLMQMSQTMEIPDAA